MTSAPRKKKMILLAIIGAIGAVGLGIIHETWIVKRPGDDREPEAQED